MDLEAEHGGEPGQLRLAVYPRYSIVNGFNDLNPRLDFFWEKDVPFPRDGLEVPVAWPAPRGFLRNLNPRAFICTPLRIQDKHLVTTNMEAP